MEFDSREAQDLNLENEKKYIFYSLVLWVSIALGLSICILLKFLAFFQCLLFFCVEGGAVSAVEIAMTTAIAIAISRHMKLA